MKKIFYILIAFLFFTKNIFSQNFKSSSDEFLKNDFPSVTEYVLENGMHLFIMEDFSSALMRVEFSCKAGFSSQTPDTQGFFSLYTNLFKYSSKNDFNILKDLHVECNADSSRYIKNISVLEFDSFIKAIFNCAYNPTFFDEDVRRELLTVKKEVSENAFSVEGFINASIDSRVFASEPWKHDSGIYPSIFENSTIASTRRVLSFIQENFYTPKNCALFISGPMPKEKILLTAEKTFGKTVVLKNNNLQKENNFKIDFQNQEKKLFVLSDPEFSPDMTQIVVQYLNLKMEQADIASAILNKNDFKFKDSLLKNEELKIRSPEYINASSTHKNGSSRLIIQALMENPKMSPCQSSIQFVKKLSDSIEYMSQEDFSDATKKLTNSFYNSLSSSSEIMNLLSEFWAIKDFKNRDNIFLENELFSELLKRPAILQNQNLEIIKNNLSSENPFVFVLVNTKVFEKYKNEFLKNGFEIITTKNGSWYSQELYKKLKENVAQKKQNENLKNADYDFFVNQNINSIKNFSLKNNIPVFIKERSATNTVCVSLLIEGGQLSDSKQNYGIESVITQCLSMNIQNAIYEKYFLHELNYFPEVKTETRLNSTCINIECVKNDLPIIIEAMSNGLIFGELIPAMVDTSISEQKSNQIVKTSNLVFQLSSAAINMIYKSKEIANVFSLNNDILKKVSFMQVLEKYTKLLNAKKLSFIISGNINFDLENKNEGAENVTVESGVAENVGVENVTVAEKINAEKKSAIENSSAEKVVELLDTYFGILESENAPLKIQLEKNANIKKSKKVKLTHLFLTDVSKEKAGPRPQVLIPTTEFLDPAQFWFEINSNVRQEIFNALLIDFSEFINEKFENDFSNNKMIVRSDFANAIIQFGKLNFLNVKNISTLDSIYKKYFTEYFENLNEEKIEQIKSNWIKNQLSKTDSNSGINNLILQSLEQDSKNPALYIEEYLNVVNASLEDFKNAFTIFNFENAIRIYSQDTSK